MKKIVLILFTGILFVSCGASQVEREARKTVNGSWTLSEISFPGSSENLRVTLFDNATAECLENSQWNFISNNNTGSYASTEMQCGADSNLFRWSIDEVNEATGTYDLMLKPTNEDYKSDTNAGFRISLINLTQDTMVWEQVVNFEGKPFTIRMNFNKN